MRFEKVTKNRQELVSEALGRDVSVVEVDGQVDSITVTRNGSVIRFGKSDYSGIQVMIPAKPETEKRFRIVSTDSDVSVNGDFEDKYEATTKLHEVANRLRLEEDVLSVEEFESIVEA